MVEGPMRPFPLLVAVALLLSGCGGAVGDFGAGVGAAATAPLEDLNLRRELIPTVLLQAEANPYDLRNLNQCSTIGAEIARLNEALGPDRDEPPAPDGSSLGERAADAASKAALDAIRDASTDFIPGRSWIRRLSGAGGSSMSGPSASLRRAISAPMVEHWLRLRRS